jgi:hypothetical protein
MEGEEEVMGGRGVDGWASREHNSISGHTGWRRVADLELVDHGGHPHLVLLGFRDVAGARILEIWWRRGFGGTGDTGRCWRGALRARRGLRACWRGGIAGVAGAAAVLGGGDCGAAACGAATGTAGAGREE